MLVHEHVKNHLTYSTLKKFVMYTIRDAENTMEQKKTDSDKTTGNIYRQTNEHKLHNNRTHEACCIATNETCSGRLPSNIDK